MPGRSWFSEVLFRTVRDLFVAGNNAELSWFREQIAKPISHPALSKVASVKQSIGGIECTLVRPNKGGDAKRVILYLHGGGYVVGAPSGHLSIIAPLALQGDCLVVAPDYRLAPEHPFPAPQDDCLAVAQAVQKAYPGSKLIIAGDSAGGALSLATEFGLQAGEFEGAKGADALILISPWVDPLADSGTIFSNTENDFLAKKFLDESMHHLMQGQALDDPRINFTQIDLSCLPPTLIQYGSGEVFADQIELFGERAKSQGVDVKVQNYSGQFHVFQIFSALLKDAKHALSEMGEFARRF
ncbi:MAG: monoterpene epsilon-lactone hydrolase [Cryomorphaceae bacterium]|jgi:monoterpene epsilon-lactone hydrolase